MTGHTEAQKEIQGRFESVWANRTPVAYPNVSFTPPERTDEAKWVRLTIIDFVKSSPEDTPQITIGSDQNSCRFTGTIIVQVFTNSDIGSTPAFTLAEEAGNVFLKWCGDSGVVCRIPTIKEVGIDSQGWYQVNVIIPFKRDKLI